MKVTYLYDVSKFIESLEKHMFPRTMRVSLLLAEYGSYLRMPYSKRIYKDLYELRIRGEQEVRIFYTILGGEAFLVYGIIKKSNKIPRKDLEVAIHRIRSLNL